LSNGDFERSAHQGELLLAAADALTFVAAFYGLDPCKVGHEVAVG
jgi:hypothetical protein